eukprot:scaffold5247_cov130-Cylindrotheca_fusiformis.AAC.13
MTSPTTDQQHQQQMEEGDSLLLSNEGDHLLVVPPKYKFGLVHLLTHMEWDVVNPSCFLKASGECLFLILSISWIITAIHNPETIQHNPLKDRLGYNNFCVGWDVTPARYVAGFLWIPCSYLGLRFVYSDLVRFQLGMESSPKSTFHVCFKYTSLFAYALALCGIILILMIPPTDEDVWTHSSFFLFFIVTRFFVVASIYRDFPDEFQYQDRVFLTVYGFISLFMPVLIVWQYWWYDFHDIGNRAPIHPWILGTIDYSWFLCLAVTAKFLPEETMLVRKVSLGENVEQSSSSGRGTPYGTENN